MLCSDIWQTIEDFIYIQHRWTTKLEPDRYKKTTIKQRNRVKNLSMTKQKYVKKMPPTFVDCGVISVSCKINGMSSLTDDPDRVHIASDWDRYAALDLLSSVFMEKSKSKKVMQFFSLLSKEVFTKPKSILSIFPFCTWSRIKVMSLVSNPLAKRYYAIKLNFKGHTHT